MGPTPGIEGLNMRRGRLELPSGSFRQTLQGRYISRQLLFLSTQKNGAFRKLAFPEQRVY